MATSSTFAGLRLAHWHLMIKLRRYWHNSLRRWNGGEHRDGSATADEHERLMDYR